MFASMIHLDICSIRNKQETISGQKNIDRQRVKREKNIGASSYEILLVCPRNRPIYVQMICKPGIAELKVQYLGLLSCVRKGV